MKRITTLLLSCLVSTGPLLAQQGVTQCGTPTGQAPFPIQSYKELPDPVAPSEKEWAAVKVPQVQWGNTDTRYAKHAVPVIQPQKSITLEGWRGEKLHAQAVVWTGTDLKGLNYSLSEFKNSKGDVLPADAFSGGFVRYVMTDELNKDGRGGCGYRPDHSIYDSLLVADPIDHLLTSMPMEAKSTQAIWINCQVPQTVSPGVYRGTVEVKDGDNRLSTLKMDIKVSSRVLPAPSQWAFHLDLWQSPFAVARYYQVPLWSQAHIDAMRPVMKMLADAGQKIITASIMHKPWNGQTYDYFESMVTWTKKVDGTWAFDYDVFDKWVEMMMSVGIDKQINCYSMVPWKLSFQYFDQATNSMQYVKTAPGEKAYEEMWVAMLKSFSKHLREKGWFDICTIAMDERPMEVMQKTLQVIRKADPEFKVSLAGNFHKELEAPAIPTPESVLTNPLQDGKAYRVFAPTGDEAVSVICYNLNTSPKHRKVTAEIDPKDYLLRETLTGKPTPQQKRVILFDWNNRTATELTGKQTVELDGFTDRLFHLCPIHDGWAVIGIQEKYLSPAAVRILSSTPDKLVLNVLSPGTLKIWTENSGKQEVRNIQVKETGKITIRK